MQRAGFRTLLALIRILCCTRTCAVAGRAAGQVAMGSSRSDEHLRDDVVGAVGHAGVFRSMVQIAGDRRCCRIEEDGAFRTTSSPVVRVALVLR